MKHIRQKDLSVYTVVDTNGWALPLEQHLSVIQHPEIFEVVDCDIPAQYQNLDYQPN